MVGGLANYLSLLVINEFYIKPLPPKFLLLLLRTCNVKEPNAQQGRLFLENLLGRHIRHWRPFGVYIGWIFTQCRRLVGKRAPALLLPHKLTMNTHRAVKNQQTKGPPTMGRHPIPPLPSAEAQPRLVSERMILSCSNAR